MNLMRQAKTRSKQKLNIQTCDRSPPPGKAHPRAVKFKLRREGGGSGGGSGAGERANQTQNKIRVNGKVEGGRSQWEARSRRSQVLSQRPTRTRPQGGVEGGRSQGGNDALTVVDTLGMTDGDAAHAD